MIPRKKNMRTSHLNEALRDVSVQREGAVDWAGRDEWVVLTPDSY